ncbi:MAG: hypothetical protein JRJ41_07360 [Deltaproteobacteria bacterium]|jgi:hypothetical protein|nr:hypothetical protein [Deltaproteobacteria bacterium]
MDTLEKFNSVQINIVNNSVAMAEELVSDYYKMSASQWLHRKYDVKTLADLKPDETVQGPFAQIVRYKGRHKDSQLGSSTYDFYKICLQDNAILSVLKQFSQIKLFPFTLYIITHELIHIVRFSKFLQNFDASHEEMMIEEARVHEITHGRLFEARVSGMEDVLKFYKNWLEPIEDLRKH